MTERMYELDGKRLVTWNPFIGCRFNCSYCTPSFRRQMKRQKRNCIQCYKYEPHFHPERLTRVPGGKLIFACAFGDVAFAAVEQLKLIFETIKKHPMKTFLLQSKCPDCFRPFHNQFPPNVMLGTTVETNRTIPHISRAVSPLRRLQSLLDIDHHYKYVTLEPLLDFDLEFLVGWLLELEPEFVYIGYDNHNCGLPEPPLEKTEELIRRLECFTEVRTKLLREANRE